MRLYSLLLILLILQACGGGGNAGNTTYQPVAQGNRVLGMDIKEIPGVVDYGTAYTAAAAMGVRELSISLDWEILEPTVGNYDNSLPAIIDSFYPAQAIDVTLVLRPLDTPGPRFPADLAGTFDNAAVLTAFDNFLTNLHAQLTALNASGKLRWIQVGNEIDAYLGSDPIRWAQWKTFFDAAKARINILWPGVEVSSVIQFSTLQNNSVLSEYQNLLPSLDNVVLTYYPLNADFTMRTPDTVAGDFDLMVTTFPTESLFLQECGYPSSAVNNSSETQQADFFTEVFKAWDTHADRISVIDIAWQYDISDAEASQLVIDFGLAGTTNEAAFKSYLATIGLSNYDATEKLALQRLRDELTSRGWQ